MHLIGRWIGILILTELILAIAVIGTLLASGQSSPYTWTEILIFGSIVANILIVITIFRDEYSDYKEDMEIIKKDLLKLVGEDKKQKEMSEKSGDVLQFSLNREISGYNQAKDEIRNRIEKFVNE